MKHYFKRFFSDKYAKREAIGANLLLLLMYRFSYPFASILSSMGFSPNQITTMSLFTSLVAATLLVFDDGWILFLVFWGGALLLDFCDGTVARKTNKIRNTAFRYDHTSDLLKFFLIILAVGIKYSDSIVWILCLAASFSFMFYMVVNHDLKTARDRIHVSSNKITKSPKNKKLYESASISSWAKISKAIYAIFMTVHGHTLLIFLVFPFGINWAISALIYLMSISLYRSAIAIYLLTKIPK
ncbi:CDP-alcohol phosphatidyltransferase family protein [Methylophaga nitratireducenticrescens]|uniref:CDP-alcohol phosphatidyltransferase family protein n=1 Tax=Methylophaga nitratireducenticrescens TaxID=754476 RepID=UPI000CDC99E6|nr:CDP-alcohol phosphatidyltransferase family protein [Methylophaga nitratireducenticrescens]AUZ84052.1 hypothetical protein CDW43_05465 [Methylophaga nitratireducenticrescens]